MRRKDKTTTITIHDQSLNKLLRKGGRKKAGKYFFELLKRSAKRTRT